MILDPLLQPRKTLADYLVIGISPALIMLLVGSLCFFLIQVLYRGAAVDSVRWVMFWFVFAVVLVARLGIEEGAGRASLYGFVLAAVTWLYLSRIHPAYLLGILMLAIVWWCANKLTRDCTLIDDEQDASGCGLLEGRQKAEGRRQKGPPGATEIPAPEKMTSGPGGKTARHSAAQDGKKARATPHAPGKWVIYFSLAALPLFGLGQMLLPPGDDAARRSGFLLLCVYLAAAVGLLLTTSFLGLRRYLRQRHLRMPGVIAFGWIRFGAGVAVIVLAAALLLPRPGAGEAWKALRYRIDYQLHRASDFAARFNPHGQGEGRPGHEAEPGDRDERNTGATPVRPDGSAQNPTVPTPAHSGPVAANPAAGWFRTFRFLLWLAAAALFCWWLLRYRHLISQIARSFVETLRRFLGNLFGFGFNWQRRAGQAGMAAPKALSFATYENPFVTGKDRSWPLERLILYSYEATRRWAAERGSQPLPQQTAREFCSALSEKFPEVGAELDRLSFLYGHAAYGMKVPEPCDLEPVKLLWRYLTA